MWLYNNKSSMHEVFKEKLFFREHLMMRILFTTPFTIALHPKNVCWLLYTYTIRIEFSFPFFHHLRIFFWGYVTLFFFPFHTKICSTCFSHFYFLYFSLCSTYHPLMYLSNITMIFNWFPSCHVERLLYILFFYLLPSIIKSTCHKDYNSRK